MAQSLTKTGKEGALYARPQAVETEIDTALQADLAAIRRRLAVTNPESADYLRSECLVHLIRSSLRSGDQFKANAALATLLVRCEANLLVKIPDGRLPNAALIREEVLSKFGELFATDGTDENPNDLDFFECRFNRAFKAFRIDLIRCELTALGQIATPPDHSETGTPEAYEEDAFAKVSDAFRTPAEQQSTYFLEELWQAINTLPSDERKAVILCHVLGFKVESENQDEVTAATLCNCKGRTIRYRLSRAAAKLSQFTEDT
jgi:hypothetical protein